MRIVAIDHVQLAMPVDGEGEARRFYGDLLGLREVPKPAGVVKLHLGVEPDFRPARKAHPALLVEGLPALVERLTRAGCRVEDAAGVPGYERVHVSDPFGNRLELMERTEQQGGRRIAGADLEVRA